MSQDNYELGLLPHSAIVIIAFFRGIPLCEGPDPKAFRHMGRRLSQKGAEPGCWVVGKDGGY